MVGTQKTNAVPSTGNGGRKLFGTDGIRGTANVHPMTPEMALALGRAIAHVFREAEGERKVILIGKDTRLSGYMFEDALAAGICSMGVNVIQVGPVPTPALAFLTRDMRCNAGVMITASHNPYRDNGIKFFASDGFKLPDEQEARIERLIETGEIGELSVPPDEIGQAWRIDDARGRYVVYLKNAFPRNLTLDGLRIVVDCANGAAYRAAPTVLRELGAEVFTLGVEPNGRNINEDCGSLYPERAAAKVRELRADVGISLDGDADRVILIDERGEIYDGDMLMWMCARDMKQRGVLRNDTLVATVMSNLGLELALAGLGVNLLRTQVGDRYVVESMREGGHVLGGEQSGHILFLEHSTTGDGMMSALQVLALMARNRCKLSDLNDGFERLPQVMVNVGVSEKRPLEDLPEFQEYVAEVEDELGDTGRVLIRYSGTENKARVMVEGRDEARVHEIANDLASRLKQTLAANAS
jgi:phosphoglucosamine mutase